MQKSNQEVMIMLEKDLVITNKAGLHARPASLFVNAAGKFESEINIEYKGTKANAKSILYVMSLGITEGETFKLLIEGTDQQEAMDTLSGLVENKFGED